MSTRPDPSWNTLLLLALGALVSAACALSPPPHAAAIDSEIFELGSPADDAASAREVPVESSPRVERAADMVELAADMDAATLALAAAVRYWDAVFAHDDARVTLGWCFLDGAPQLTLEADGQLAWKHDPPVR